MTNTNKATGTERYAKNNNINTNTAGTNKVAPDDRQSAANGVPVPISSDWLKYDPKRYKREMLKVSILTNGQRNQIFDVSTRNNSRDSMLAEYCTPENAGWIFAVADKVIHDLSEKVGYWEQSACFSLIMALNFEPIYLASPRTLHNSVVARLNAYHDSSPEMMEATIRSLLLAGDFVSIENMKARIVSEYSSWQDGDSSLADKLLD